MKKYHLKQKIAVMLCMAMLFAQAVPAAFAEGQGGQGDVVTTETTPPPDNTETTPPPDNTETTPPPDNTETTPPPDNTETTPPPDNTETTPPPDNTETTPPDNTETTPPDNTENTPPQEQGFSGSEAPGADGGFGTFNLGTFNLERNVTPELTTPVSYTYTKANPTANAGGSVSAAVEYTGSDQLMIAIYPEGSTTAVGDALLRNSGERFTFSNLAAGKYQINYVFVSEMTLEHHDIITIESESVQPPQPPAAPELTTPVSYTYTKANPTANAGGSVSAAVEYTGSDQLMIAIYPEGSTTAVGDALLSNSGERFTFSNLAAGKYQINYVFVSEMTLEHHDIITIESESAQPPQPPAAPELTTPVSYTYTKANPTANAGGSVSAAVEYTGSDQLMIAIYPEGSTTAVGDALLSNTGERFTFSNLAAGKYQINYVFVSEMTLEHHDIITIESESAQQPQPPTISVKYTCTSASSATAENGVIEGTVTVQNGTYPLYVELFRKASTSPIRSATLDSGSTTFIFDKLPAGEYLINYAFDGSQTVDKQDAVKVEYTARAAIAITSVTPGEKTLTIRGTAQAGAQILVQAEPAGAQAEVLVVGSDGKFETSLSANPGVYSKVSVFYVTDVNSIVHAGGSWTVNAPTTAPAIAVDPVDNHSTTVVVKTGANMAVTLKTSDSTQTLVSDANGLAHFSLTHKYLKGEEFTITVVYGSGSGQTVSQKVTVGGVADYNDLEYGDYGEAVLRLTTRLNQLGYPIAPTKDYNGSVREAVRLFQIANGQEADGEAGDRMQAALYSVGAIRYGSGRYPTLVRGDKGLALIKTLQQRLKDLGYYTIKVDGIFGSGTQRAVRLFQSVNGLPETGIADNATQVLLYSSAAKPLGYGGSGSYSTLQRSSKYKSAVVPLQRRLRELGYYSGSIDGYFGSKTYRAVRNFQSRNGLSVTGVADAYTQQVLYSAAAKKYNGSVAGSASSGTTTGYRLLYWGCRGAEVTRLQNALIDAGYKKLVRSADGIYGQWTYDAVCAYQRDHGLTVDGIAGKNTQNKLYGTNY